MTSNKVEIPMSKPNWTTPPIFKLLVIVQKLLQEKNKNNIETRLIAAKQLLDRQMQELAKQNKGNDNGK